MKFIDFFAGIGGFRKGLELAGHKCVGFIEWDKYARKSYQAIYDTKGEFTATDVKDVCGVDLPKADIWTFGSPCTDISIAGKQKGLVNGKQSSMFFEVIRCLQERTKNKKTLPKYLFMENVKALLSSNGGRDFGRVLIEMDKVGYDVEWSVINSSDVVPQNRERVYIIGHLRAASTRKVFPITRQGKRITQRPKVLGNYSDKRHQSNIVYSNEGISPTLTATDYKRPVKVMVKQVENIKDTSSFGGNPQTGRVYDPKGLSPTLNTMQGGGREPKIIVKPVLTPDRINKRQNGRRFKNAEEPEFTLTAQDKHGVLIEKENNIAIRKLTPKECWRLQGFSDEDFEKAKSAGVSNSQLYKQAGNAVTVPVIKEIGLKL
ncbi:DNA (cytosine-5-)-methyltransferase [Lactobacillus sp. PV037]|uniref:DNA cytosine methyltransferase n=1 Tax=Lactobacillus sp. PV037 TaxID=2594496 RepID=UPI00223F227F|nr:DNA cytosine methyltransferase [Lactobacillus sp. PV037]QNQ83776.1 DNA (cytosine-5-)-methyltransferase [Lactobacillus sp. PV037]